MKLGNEMIRSSGSLAVNDDSSDANYYSSQATGENDKKIDTGNIEEAESSLRENGSLNYEEARALLGRYEYQKGNIEAALHVFEGIDLATLTPKMKTSLTQRSEPRKKVSHNYGDPPLSTHAVGLLLEAIYLKSKSLQMLQRYKEAAQSCKLILDIIESSLPEGLPENFGTDCKLQETLNHAIELLPELWKLAGSPQEAVLSFRRALLHHQTLSAETTAKIQKDFAFFLLYNGGEEAIPPNLRSQMDTSFVPKNNIEEAILLLMILLRKVSLQMIKWDPLILDHLCYALSISNGLGALCAQLEELPPGIIDNKERYVLLALCYHGQEGASCAKRAIRALESSCDEMVGIAYYLLGISISGHCRSAISDLERVEKQTEVIQCLETGGKFTGMNDSTIVYNLSLENAEQRKLDVALGYAKRLVKMEGGSSVKGWILLARILSGQKRFSEGETVINAALEQTGKWDQGELLRTKARLQVAQGEIKNAIQTYTQILAVLQVQGKSFRSQKKNQEIGGKHLKSLEMETWHDLAMVYMKLSQWVDAEACLLKSETIDYYSASRLHITGLLYEAKGLDKEAQKAYELALDMDPSHVPSLVSLAVIIRRTGVKPAAAAKSFLTEALRLDRLNSSAWYNLGLFYKEDGPMFVREAANCFEAASILGETEPIEPFR
ncbi:hypothetical protein M8C21_008811 [Ambrosia artemisiifolia]|uniref:Uncharacterized protein n=1 Tax=Ambrosia artemisiifolia TaxID=4212 RepID=A0AAD5C5K9_AMBAR|nr:hypothetical protein M8C21_008811 [Ambrosia artemisiifolia]